MNAQPFQFVKIAHLQANRLSCRRSARDGRQPFQVGCRRRQRLGNCGILGPRRHTSFAGIARRTQVVTLGAIAIDGAIVTGTCTTGVFAE
jgi:hypothetical protein